MMLRSEIKSRPISMSQIFYAQVYIENEKSGDYINMGEIPLVFFLIDIIYFLISSSDKQIYQQIINDENQDYTVYLKKDGSKLFASFVKNGGIKSIEFDLPEKSEISNFAKIFIEDYMRLVPELEGYSNMKYVYKELSLL